MTMPSRWRLDLLAVGALLVIAGVLLPRDWYDALPKRDGALAPPIKGVTLLQWSLVVQGVLALWLSIRRWEFRPVGEADRLRAVPRTEGGEEGPSALFTLSFAATLALTVVLRLMRVSSDLWLDEITPLQDYGRLSPLAVVGSFLSSNNHLLNTLLTQLSVAVFGEAEWSVRLPAVMFGIATVPAVYWVARMAFGRWTSLGAAFLLSVSYHHVFFSQNARGYSAYIFFSLVGSGLLLRGLQEDRLRTWVGYTLVMVLACASLLNSGFVVAAHACVGVAALWDVRRRGGTIGPLGRRLGAVMALVGLLVLQLYATVLPQVYMFIRTAYVGAGSGFSLTSGEFFRELARGLSAGFGPGLLLGAVPFLLLAAVGFLAFWRRRWILALTLVLPLVLTSAYLVFNGLTFSPRFFIFALPVAMITAVPSLQALADLASRLLGRRGPAWRGRLAAGFVLLLGAASLVSLRAYYETPKQSYRASLGYLESVRQPGEIVFVVYNAERGYRYYLDRLGVAADGIYFPVRTVDSLDAVLARHPGAPSYLVTTFPRSLHFHSEALEARLHAGWVVQRVFPGTVGDGAISIWSARRP